MPENKSSSRGGLFLNALVAIAVGVFLLLVFLISQFVVFQPIGPGSTATPTIPLSTPSPTALGTEAPSPSGPQAAVQDELRTLTSGVLAFNPPATMTVGETDRVEVRIQSGPLTVTSTQALTKGFEGNGIATVEPISTYTFMRARLVGNSFDITPLDAEEQAVSGDNYTQWAWDVRPTEAGSQKLNLIVSVRVKISGYPDESRDFPVKTKAVNVQVNLPYSAGRFVEGNWQWLAAIILIPLGVFAYRQVTGRRQQTAAGPTLPQVPLYLAQLHKNLYTHFNNEELETLCMNLGIQPDALSGEDIVSKSRELVLYFHRRNAINQLVAACKAERPDVNWDLPISL
jgi:hypothetical protein